MGRAPCCAKEGMNRGAWTFLEDKILKDYIKIHGEGKWRDLPAKAGLKRCGKSCRLRWLNYLRPDIKRGNISEEEEDLIIRLHKLLGNRWALIAGRLPGRTDNEIKNYWNTILGKKAKATSSTTSTKHSNQSSNSDRDDHGKRKELQQITSNNKRQSLESRSAIKSTRKTQAAVIQRTSAVRTKALRCSFSSSATVSSNEIPNNPLTGVTTTTVLNETIANGEQDLGKYNNVRNNNIASDINQEDNSTFHEKLQFDFDFDFDFDSDFWELCNVEFDIRRVDADHHHRGKESTTNDASNDCRQPFTSSCETLNYLSSERMTW